MERTATLLAWPAARIAGRSLTARGCPIVWIVDRAGDPPADWSEIEDWIRLPVDQDELLARIDGVEQRALARANRPWIDDDDLLRHGDEWVALSPLEARLLRRLLQLPNTVVPRADI